MSHYSESYSAGYAACRRVDRVTVNSLLNEMGCSQPIIDMALNAGFPLEDEPEDVSPNERCRWCRGYTEAQCIKCGTRVCSDCQSRPEDACCADPQVVE